jgi:hypothetical protein
MRTVLAIDPGTTESAYVLWDGKRILHKDKVNNAEMFPIIRHLIANYEVSNFCIERVASYGMAVGQTTFDTCVYAGRFLQYFIDKANFSVTNEIFRKDIKLHHCGMTRAKDSNIITSLVDRFEPNEQHGKYGKGTKKDPGLFFGFSKDVWQAFALAVYYYDTFITKK